MKQCLTKNEALQLEALGVSFDNATYYYNAARKEFYPRSEEYQLREGDYITFSVTDMLLIMPDYILEEEFREKAPQFRVYGTNCCGYYDVGNISTDSWYQYFNKKELADNLYDCLVWLKMQNLIK